MRALATGNRMPPNGRTPRRIRVTPFGWIPSVAAAGIVLVLLAPTTFAVGPEIRVTAPFVGTPFSSVNATAHGCHSHTRILLSPAFNLSTGRVAFRGEADARNVAPEIHRPREPGQYLAAKVVDRASELHALEGASP